ncbi:MAG: type VI secretion system baseplate subunit TssF [Desulfobacterales bacterium]|nr:type VI secretion system baseplate subunit TssF [Desulfobacterales bacterium]
MFNRFFKQEKDLLKELGAEFSKAHPELARMLDGPSADPDVERLLEGVAFLTALLRQKLDDEFPEIVHELVHLIFPHFLRPLPSATIIAFSPKKNLKQSMIIEKGIQVASLPVQGTPCIFQTCYDVDVHPIELLDSAKSEPSGRSPMIKLMLELKGMKLSDWNPEKLRLFLAGDYSDAANLYHCLRDHLTQIVLKASDSNSICVLSPDHLKPVGFSYEDNESLIPFPSQAFPAYRILQEYFTLPAKFLFLDLTGWEKWDQRGDGTKFEINFEFDSARRSISMPLVREKPKFVLSATPAVNIFQHEADPIRLDHRKSEYLVRPSTTDPDHYQVYSVEKVVGFTHGTARERIYTPFEVFNPEPESNPTYHLSRRESPVRSEANVFLKIAYPKNAPLSVSETLSIKLLCSNGSLPENIKIKDICIPTDTSPEFVEFENIIQPTPNILPPMGKNLLWHLLSHLSLNYVSLANSTNLQTLLKLYIFEESRDRQTAETYLRKVSGIRGVESGVSNRLVQGIMMRGREIRIKASNDHFASPGDLYLFGCVLDYFLSSYASVNTYTNLFIEDILKGDRYSWPARMGEHFLI